LARNVDPFVSARYAALAAGSELTNWIVRKAVGETLSKLKAQTGSNQSLLQFVADGMSSVTPVNTARRRRLSVSSLNHRSIRFSQELEVGVK
jgi:hypothetical protein